MLEILQCCENEEEFFVIGLFQNEIDEVTELNCNDRILAAKLFVVNICSVTFSDHRPIPANYQSHRKLLQEVFRNFADDDPTRQPELDASLAPEFYVLMCGSNEVLTHDHVITLITLILVITL